MTRDDLINGYFEWMCLLIKCPKITKRKSYNKLLCYLHGKDFDYILEMDGNRADDGIELRYTFGNQNSIPASAIASMLDNTPCSVLEMMVALVHRCEESIMNDPDIGDRTGVWFWDMIECLGLFGMDDEHFDRDFVEDVLNRFMDREYASNGRGGLFLINNRHEDMRNIEIWYQMMWYLDEKIEN